MRKLRDLIPKTPTRFAIKRRGIESISLDRDQPYAPFGIDACEPWRARITYREDVRPNLRVGCRYKLGRSGTFRLHYKAHPVYEFHQIADPS
jgi:hypothetical protein